MGSFQMRSCSSAATGAAPTADEEKAILIKQDDVEKELDSPYWEHVDLYRKVEGERTMYGCVCKLDGAFIKNMARRRWDGLCKLIFAFVAYPDFPCIGLMRLFQNKKYQ